MNIAKFFILHLPFVPILYNERPADYQLYPALRRILMGISGKRHYFGAPESTALSVREIDECGRKL